MPFTRVNGKYQINLTGIKFYATIAVLGWTVFVAVVSSWNIYHHKSETLEIARNYAQASFEKDLVHRRWATKHGGVYVPVTKDTPPNPYLSQIEERDITTPSGRQLTLMNPAYMTRQVLELGAEQYGLRGHLTSLNPIRPENAPDPWEKETLKGFDKNPVEVTSLEKINGQPHMRLMKPMVTEQRCLKCHASQGYKVGDIRGGVSVSVPMEPIWAIANTDLKKMALGYGAIWVLGLIGIGTAGKQIKNRITQYKQAELKYQTLYESSSDAVMMLDEKGFFDCNEATVKIFGCKNKNEFCGKHPSDMSPATQPCGTDSMTLASLQIDAAMNKDLNQFEWVHKKIDGTEFHADVLLNTMELDGKQVLQAVVRDITERKQAEEAIHLANQQLRANEEDLKRTNYKLGERAKELNCLYSISQIVGRDNITLEDIIQKIAELIPPGWQYPEITEARITLKERRFETSGFRKTAWIQSANIELHGQKAGSIEVCYLKNMPVIDEGCQYPIL